MLRQKRHHSTKTQNELANSVVTHSSIIGASTLSAYRIASVCSDSSQPLPRNSEWLMAFISSVHTEQ